MTKSTETPNAWTETWMAVQKGYVDAWLATGEVLTDTASVGDDVTQWRRDIGKAGAVIKVLIDALGEFAHGRE